MELKKGQIIEGDISRIVEEAVFVDIGADRKVVISRKDIDRLDSSQMDMIQEGNTVSVYIYHVPHNGGNPLGSIAKATEKENYIEDEAFQAVDQLSPWEKAVNEYQVGNLVEGTVTNIRRYGAFVRLSAGVEGLIHVSEMEEGFTPNPSDVVSPGDKVLVRIIRIEPERKRIGLSLKQTGDDFSEDYS
jgi:small subunit ribosomal protein S1